MKKIYKELFFVPQEGKISEKAFLVRISMSVAVILLSLAAMSFTAYAYFSHTATAQIAMIQSASWNIEVVSPEGVTQAEGCYIIEKESTPKTYEFIIRKSEKEATATIGYARIDVKTDVDNFSNTQTFYTQCLGKVLVEGQMSYVSERVVKVTVPAGNKMIMQFVGEWGTCSKTPIIDENEGISPVFAVIKEEPKQPEQSEQPTSGSQQETQTEKEEQPTEQTQDTVGEELDEGLELENKQDKE